MRVVNNLPIGLLKFLSFLAGLVGGVVGLILVLAILLFFTGGLTSVKDTLYGARGDTELWIELTALSLGAAPGVWLGWGVFVSMIDKDTRHHLLPKPKS
jgi:hypothetical protein